MEILPPSCQRIIRLVLWKLQLGVVKPAVQRREQLGREILGVWEW